MKLTLFTKIGIIVSLLVLSLLNPTLANTRADTNQAPKAADSNLDEDPLAELQTLTQQELVGVQAKIATGIKQPIDQSPAIATVITAEDIQAMGATDIDEALETVPGLHVARDMFTYTPTYTFRGMYSLYNPEVLVLVNGISVNQLWSGNRGEVWGGMPVEAIARIEIIRGPGSALYGADAFAGVINIITKTKNEIEGTEIGSRLGSFKTKDAWILHGGNYHGFDLALTLEYHTTDGQRKIIEADNQTFYDKLFGTHASLAPGTVNLQRDNLDARLDISKGHWQWRTGYQGRHDMGDGIPLSLNPTGIYRDDRFNTDLTYHHPNLTDHWEVTNQLSFFRHGYETRGQAFFPPGAFGGAYPEGMRIDTSESEVHARWELSGVYSGWQTHKIHLGGGYAYEEIYQFKHFTNTDPVTGLPVPPARGLLDISNTPYAAIPEGKRKNWHVFLQDIWELGADWQATTGVRYDNFSDFGTTVNPRLALVWRTRADFTTKLLYGQAFRAPSWSDLYARTPIQLGNSNLDPETIQTGEVGFDYNPSDNLNLGLNLFVYQWNDGIRYQPNTSGTFVAQNTATQNGYGFEWKTQWLPLPSLKLLGNYAFQNAKDENDRDPGNAPHHQVYLQSDWQFWPNWYWNTQLKWIGERKRAFGDPREPLEGYTMIDLTLRRKYLKDQWDVAVAVRNLLDADAREPSRGPNSSGAISVPYDLPLAGRNVWVEMRYHF